METLFRLLDPEPNICTVSAHNLMARVVPKDGLASRTLSLSTGTESSMETFVSALSALGYSRMSMVEERGEMSVRGGILDLFSPGYASPVRIEFFGDMVESIRSFEISTQRSLKELAELRVLPPGASPSASASRARQRLIERANLLPLEPRRLEALSRRLRETDGPETPEALTPLFYESPLDTLFDYMNPRGVIAVIDPSMTEAAFVEFSSDIEAAAERLHDKGAFFVEPERLYMEPEEVSSALKSRRSIFIEPLKSVGLKCLSESNLELTHTLAAAKAAGGREDEGFLAPLVKSINEWLDEGRRVLLTAHNSGQAERTRELLEGYQLTPSIVKGAEAMAPCTPGFRIAIGALSTGFRLPGEELVIVSEEEVFGERVKRRQTERPLDAFLTDLKDLSAGDPIVHALHGIGLYHGLKRIDVDGVENDFLLLEYRGGDKLYQPVWRMDLLSRYHGVEGAKFLLDKLGTAGWTKKQGRVRQAVEQMAGELLLLYAEREAAKGFAYSAPDKIFLEFEAGFEYDETPDQARAIDECHADMEKERPMDRLICGDVGYGKTEVAIRAAFKAALDSKQTAVLVPTTVLAQQHYLVFTRRLAPYPVSVGVLSRFCSAAEQADTIDRLKDGRIDIIIGTHKLLQNNIRFKDLGLIIIDEEHRFGVAQKERLKRLKRSVDALALTATPIPRTLHMSIAGIRDLSIINTAPADRLAIKTTVIGLDEEIIAEAILRELRRGGQVFFVHNRIKSIGGVEELLRRIAPSARIAVAHGQMREGDLEKRMLGFVNKEYDLLLCTAIIESGLDIPSANTIIINHAERFGLADLYQLRGRVGRSAHRAYAYFICPDTAALTDEARKRIEVIRDLCEPGSGFRIATHDLEIRGAGELLGTSQSGHIAEVGFDMYTRLLEEAIGELKGTATVDEITPEIHLRVSQYLPEEYIPDTRQRLGLYKRLASVSSEEELYSITDELTDRYGESPALVLNLLHTVALRLLMKRLMATELVQKGTRLYITFGNLSEAGNLSKTGDLSEAGNLGKTDDLSEAGNLGKTDDIRTRLVEKLVRMAHDEPKRYRVTPDSRLIIFMDPAAQGSPEAIPWPIKEARYVLKALVKACYS
jgi:transcription-repair coupling factor (superfamily II helicase)